MGGLCTKMESRRRRKETKYCEKLFCVILMAVYQTKLTKIKDMSFVLSL